MAVHSLDNGTFCESTFAVGGKTEVRRSFGSNSTTIKYFSLVLMTLLGLVTRWGSKGSTANLKDDY